MPTDAKNSKVLKVSAIKQGTVIDHMPEGSAIKVLELFNLASLNKDKAPNQATQVTVGIYLKCENGVFKDIIKLENKQLTEQELANIAVFAPDATINLIEDYGVVKKFKVKVPNKLNGVLACPNSSCITNCEQTQTSFDVTDEIMQSGSKRCSLRCVYCDRTFEKVF